MSSPASAPTSASFVRPYAPGEYPKESEYSLGEGFRDNLRLCIVCAVLLAGVAALTFTGYGVIVAGVVLTILAVLTIVLGVCAVSDHRQLRHLQALRRDQQQTLRPGPPPP
ncbi:MAG: hypothetical protein Q8R16_02030 [bacterium]|nr:hypothetical protein [bacterium]